MYSTHPLSHQYNYYASKAAIARKRCLLICIVKANRYRHRSVQTATLLSDVWGANAFAVTTLEEAIVLRRALKAVFAATMVKAVAVVVCVGGGIKIREADTDIVQPNTSIF